MPDVDLAPTWWSEQDLAREWPAAWVPKGKAETCGHRFAPNVSMTAFIAFHSPLWFLVYGDDVDPMQVAFIVYQGALLGAMLCFIIMLCIDPGIVRPKMDRVFYDAGRASPAVEPAPAALAGKASMTAEPLLSVAPASWHEGMEDEELFPLEFGCGIPTPMKTVHGVKLKWCFTCKHWRQPGTVHCSICGFCMESYDHHCGVVGQCIARRTHRFFCMVFVFAATAAVAGLVGAVQRLIVLKDQHAEWQEYNWYFGLASCFYLGGWAIGMVPFSLGNLWSASCAGVRMDNRGGDASCDVREPVLFWCSPLRGMRSAKHPFGHKRGYSRCVHC